MIVFFPTAAGGGAQNAIDIHNGQFAGEASAGPKRVIIEVKKPGRKFVDEQGNEQTEDAWLSVGGNDLSYEVLEQDNMDVRFDLAK